MSAFGAPSFNYRGKIPPSKSLLNRYLVVNSFLPTASHGFLDRSRCDDVLHMQHALQAFAKGETDLWCGEAGTVLRFLALRVSRKAGTYTLQGVPKLFSRPQGPLLQILKALGIEATLGKDFLKIHGNGWQKPSGGELCIDQSQSSQFASAVLLSAWNLDFALTLTFSKLRLSDAYFQMTQKTFQDFSGQCLAQTDCLLVPKTQLPRLPTDVNLYLEADMSSAFCVAALAAVGGACHLQDINLDASSQPDAVFGHILKKLGAAITWSKNSLDVARNPGALNFKGVDLSLKNCPDLFPVLAVLCAFASNSSFLREAPHLVHKESDRLAKTADLLRLCNRRLNLMGDDVEIVGLPLNSADIRADPFEFDASGDHRLVMASLVLLYLGLPIKIKGVETLKKSFPELVDIVVDTGARIKEA